MKLKFDEMRARSNTHTTPYYMVLAAINGTYAAGTKYEKQVFVQPGSNVFAHDNSFCGGISSKKDRKQQGEKRRHQRQRRGTNEQEMYTVCDKSICSLCCFIIYVLLSTIIDTYCGN